MALLGNGIENGSPFYAGYTYQAPNVTAPTGLIDAAAFVGKGYDVGAGAGASATSETTKKGKDEVTLVPGLLATSKDIKDELDDVDASMAAVKAKMSTKLIGHNNPNEYGSIVKEEGQQLSQLYAKRSQLQSLLEPSNTEVSRYNETYKSYADKTNDSLGETAVMPAGDGTFVSAGKGKLTDYSKFFNDINNTSSLKKSTDVYNATNYSIQPNDLPNTPTQKGAFIKQSTKLFGDAKENVNKTKWENPNIDMNNVDQLTGAYAIYSGAKSSNIDALKSAANIMYENLDNDAKADITAQMLNAVSQDGDMTKGLISSTNKKVILSPEQVKAVKNQIKGDSYDKSEYKQAIANYAAARITDQIPTYTKTETENESSVSDAGVTAAGRAKAPIILKPEKANITLASKKLKEATDKDGKVIPNTWITKDGKTTTDNTKADLVVSRVMPLGGGEEGETYTIPKTGPKIRASIQGPLDAWNDKTKDYARLSGDYDVIAIHTYPNGTKWATYSRNVPSTITLNGKQKDVSVPTTWTGPYEPARSGVESSPYVIPGVSNGRGGADKSLPSDPNN